MIPRLLFLALVTLGPAGLAADPTPVAPTEVAAGIDYVRLADTAPAPAVGPTILDLRLVTPGNLPLPWIRTAGPTRIVLVDAAHAAGWAAALADRSPRVLLLGPTTAADVVDLTVDVSPEDTQAAVEAIESGVHLAALALPSIEKRRFDEASLVRRHNGDNGASPADPIDAAPGEDEQSPSGDAGNDDARDDPAVDPVLQRAVQILQGLQALGRA